MRVRKIRNELISPISVVIVEEVWVDIELWDDNKIWNG